MFVILREVEKRLESGSDFVLCRLPGGGHLLVLRSGEWGRTKEQILALLSKHMPDCVAKDIFETHLSESRQAGDLALVITGFEFLSPGDPSYN